MEALPEGSDDCNLLAEFLLYCDMVQLVVNSLWGLSSISLIKNLHEVFYKELRGFNFRAYYVKKRIYTYSRALVKAMKGRQW